MKSRSPTICPMVYSLDIFGDKWTLLVLRDILIFDKTHFRQFLASKEKIASNILSNRLNLLVHNQFLVKDQDPANKSAAIYRPTQKTLDLLPMILEMMKWGAIYNPDTDKDSGPVMRQLLRDPSVLLDRIVNKFDPVLNK
jgi:DNA-binding HxlR family transcriptional regulator